MNHAGSERCDATTGASLHASDPSDAQLRNSLAEPFAFALLTWPAAALAVHFSAEDEFWWRVGAPVWLAVFHFAAYRRGRGAGFGNVMLFNSAVVALAWWAFPSRWCWAAFPLLLIGLHGAQRALLRRSRARDGP